MKFKTITASTLEILEQKINTFIEDHSEGPINLGSTLRSNDYWFTSFTYVPKVDEKPLTKEESVEVVLKTPVKKTRKARTVKPKKEIKK